MRGRRTALLMGLAAIVSIVGTAAAATINLGSAGGVEYRLTAREFDPPGTPKVTADCPGDKHVSGGAFVVYEPEGTGTFDYSTSKPTDGGDGWQVEAKEIAERAGVAATAMCADGPFRYRDKKAAVDPGYPEIGVSCGRGWHVTGGGASVSRKTSVTSSSVARTTPAIPGSAQMTAGTPSSTSTSSTRSRGSTQSAPRGAGLPARTGNDRSWHRDTSHGGVFARVAPDRCRGDFQWKQQPCRDPGSPRCRRSGRPRRSARRWRFGFWAGQPRCSGTGRAHRRRDLRPVTRERARLSPAVRVAGLHPTKEERMPDEEGNQEIDEAPETPLQPHTDLESKRKTIARARTRPRATSSRRARIRRTRPRRPEARPRAARRAPARAMTHPRSSTTRTTDLKPTRPRTPRPGVV